MVACKHGTMIRSRSFKISTNSLVKETPSYLFRVYHRATAISRTIPALVAHKIETRRVKDIIIT